MVIPVTEMPRLYAPTLLALKLPEIFTALAALGLAGAFAATWRRHIVPQRRAVYLLIVLAAALPVLLVVALRPAMYNGLRHFLFVLPPLAALGGLAAAWIYEIAAGKPLIILLSGVILAIGLALPVANMIRLHPYEYTYLNSASGGVAHAASGSTRSAATPAVQHARAVARAVANTDDCMPGITAVQRSAISICSGRITSMRGPLRFSSHPRTRTRIFARFRGFSPVATRFRSLRLAIVTVSASDHLRPKFT